MFVSHRSPSYPAEQWQLFIRKKKRISFNISFIYFYDLRINSPKAPFFKNFTGCTIAAWISVASVNGCFTVLAMITRCANTFVVSLSCRAASSAVFTRERKTGVAFCKNLVRYFTFIRHKTLSKINHVLIFVKRIEEQVLLH